MSPHVPLAKKRRGAFYKYHTFKNIINVQLIVHLSLLNQDLLLFISDNWQED
jgi:hypothetical protein